MPPRTRPAEPVKKMEYSDLEEYLGELLKKRIEKEALREKERKRIHAQLR